MVSSLENTINSILVTVCLIALFFLQMVQAHETAMLFFQDLDWSYYAWNTVKFLMACSPILAIAAVLVFSKESDEEENAKREAGAGCKS